MSNADVVATDGARNMGERLRELVRSGGAAGPTAVDALPEPEACDATFDGLARAWGEFAPAFAPSRLDDEAHAAKRLEWMARVLDSLGHRGVAGRVGSHRWAPWQYFARFDEHSTAGAPGDWYGIRRKPATDVLPLAIPSFEWEAGRTWCFLFDGVSMAVVRMEAEGEPVLWLDFDLRKMIESRDAAKFREMTSLCHASVACAPAGRESLLERWIQQASGPRVVFVARKAVDASPEALQMLRRRLEGVWAELSEDARRLLDHTSNEIAAAEGSSERIPALRHIAFNAADRLRELGRRVDEYYEPAIALIRAERTEMESVRRFPPEWFDEVVECAEGELSWMLSRLRSTAEAGRSAAGAGSVRTLVVVDRALLAGGASAALDSFRVPGCLRVVPMPSADGDASPGWATIWRMLEGDVAAPEPRGEAGGLVEQLARYIVDHPDWPLQRICDEMNKVRIQRGAAAGKEIKYPTLHAKLRTHLPEVKDLVRRQGGTLSARGFPPKEREK